MSSRSLMSALSGEHAIASPARIPVRPIPWNKRALDIALSAGGLALSAPIWAILATIIKLEDGGPVFFGQERVGEGGGVVEQQVQVAHRHHVVVKCPGVDRIRILPQHHRLLAAQPV